MRTICVLFSEPHEVIENEEEEDTSEPTISTPSMSESESEHLFGKHEPVTFMCKIGRGDQPVTWFKDGRQIQDGEDGCVVTLDGDRCLLTVPNSETASSSIFTAKCGDADVAVKVVTIGELNWNHAQGPGCC